jgi:hypothetical protein
MTVGRGQQRPARGPDDTAQLPHTRFVIRQMLDGVITHESVEHSPSKRQAFNVAGHRKKHYTLAFSHRSRRSNHSPSEIERDDASRSILRQRERDGWIRSTSRIEEQAARTGEGIGDRAQGFRCRENRNLVVVLSIGQLPNVAAKLDVQILDRTLVSGSDRLAGLDAMPLERIIAFRGMVGGRHRVVALYGSRSGKPDPSEDSASAWLTRGDAGQP